MRFADGNMPLVDLNLRIEAGQIVSVVGPSGCGKTTLLRTIAGFQPPAQGNVHFAPEVSSRCGQLGFVFQKAALTPWRNAWQNVALPLELIGSGNSQSRRQDAWDWLDRVGLEPPDFEKRPDQLSGGMQMRVSIARALVTNPSVLLLDEPFAALDDVLRQRLGYLLQELWLAQHRTMILVTHNIQEAVLLSQRVLVLQDGRSTEDVAIPETYPRSGTIAEHADLLACFQQVNSLLQEDAR